METTEQRKHLRLRWSFPVSLRKDGLENWVEGASVNISQRGVFIRSESWHLFQAQDRTVIINEIAYLRESWETLIHQHFPDQPDRRTILRQLIEALSFIKAEHKDGDVESEISELSRLQERMMGACFLPSQNEMWFQHKIQPLWTSIFSKTDLRASGRTEIEDLLNSLRKSFHVGTDGALREDLRGLPDQLKRQWVDLAYRQVNGGDDGYITRYISLLEAIPFDLPRKNYSLTNLLCLKPLVEVLPEIEKAVNHSLAQLKNSW